MPQLSMRRIVFILLFVKEAESKDMERIYVCGFCGDKIKAIVIYSGANANYIKITENGPEFDCVSNQSIPPIILLRY